MNYTGKFIQATREYNTFEKNVPAPYIRKTFISKVNTTAKVLIAVCGFYELYINGEKYNKGIMAPYICNTDDYIYFDEYDVPIDEGENVIGIILGNGFQNNPGGYVWDFDKTSFRSAPMMSLRLEYSDLEDNSFVVESDSSFKVMESPIRMDDYRFGEIYDANFEISDWNQKGYDDSEWKNAIEVKPPKGEFRICKADPITIEKEIKPINITRENDSYIYDFGENNAGVCRLNIQGNPGQKIEMQHAETLKDGKFFIGNIWFWSEREHPERDMKIVHKDIYICKGEGKENYMPRFTYHGFRYVKVSGITEEQATKNLLTYVVIHSDLKEQGGFTCSNEVVNKLQEITRRSDLSNFHYFPTDCPQREKNGWTGDAALSCEHILLNYKAENSYAEWLRNICKAQNEQGALPGIIPTGGWGFAWGNGPAWDMALVYIPYYVYVYRGKTEMIKDSAETFIKYLRYLMTRLDEKGLIHIGLGDWCHVGGLWPAKAPLEVTDSIISMDIADKIAFLFEVIGMDEYKKYAEESSQKIRNAIRKELIDYNTMSVLGNCQTCQAMGLYYGLFSENEIPKALDRLLEMIHEADDHMDIGTLGARVIFHVLSDFGYSDLALKMIIRPDGPSYGHWLEKGATTLWETFDDNKIDSLNHHFWGDISAWFIKNISGIHFNPQGNDITKLDIKPSFVKELESAEGYYIAPAGKIISAWERKENGIVINLEIPKNINACVILKGGYKFVDGTTEKKVVSGEYFVIA